MTTPEDRPATAGLFIVEDGLGEATLWRRGERHPVALCRQSDVAAEVWALILAALSVAPQPQLAGEPEDAHRAEHESYGTWPCAWERQAGVGCPILAELVEGDES